MEQVRIESYVRLQWMTHYWNIKLNLSPSIYLPRSFVVQKFCITVTLHLPFIHSIRSRLVKICNFYLGSKAAITTPWIGEQCGSECCPATLVWTHNWVFQFLPHEPEKTNAQERWCCRERLQLCGSMNSSKARLSTHVKPERQLGRCHCGS